MNKRSSRKSRRMAIILSGIIGLFVGAIIFALGYKLFLAWLNEDTQEEQEPHKSE